MVLDQGGEIKRILTKKSGLPSDIIRAFYSGRQGGVWISTDAGVARFDPALSSFGEEQGLRGGVTAIGRIDGSLLEDPRKTAAVSSAPPEVLVSSFAVWRHASASFALMRN